MQYRVISLATTIALATTVVCSGARAGETATGKNQRNATPQATGTRTAKAAPQVLAMTEGPCAAGKAGQQSARSLAAAPKDVLRTRLRDRDACVRKSAVDAIGKSGDEAWLEDLRAAFKDADAQVRASAAASLGRVLDRNRPKGVENADDRFVQGLIGLLRDRSQQVRRAAAESLQLISGMDLDYSPGYWEAWWEDSLFLRARG